MKMAGEFNMNGLMGKIYSLSELIMKLAYLNLLWILFTLLGLGLFGLFPATSAMFSTIRKWIFGEGDKPIFSTFWFYFKRDFKQANILGYILIIVGLVLYFDLKFFQASNHILFIISTFIFFILLFVYGVILLYIFPVFVHYDFKIPEYIKYTLIIAIGRPVITAIMIAGVLFVSVLLNTIPGLIPFFGGSILGGVLMWIASLSLPKVNISKHIQKNEI